VAPPDRPAPDGRSTGSGLVRGEILPLTHPEAVGAEATIRVDPHLPRWGT